MFGRNKAPELEGFRRPKWAQMKAELFLQIVLVFIFLFVQGAYRRRGNLLVDTNNDKKNLKTTGSTEQFCYTYRESGKTYKCLIYVFGIFP